MGCSWFNTETNKKKTSINNKNMHLKYVDKKSPVMRPNLQPKIYKSPAKNLQISSCSIATLSHVCNYKVQFCAFKGDAQNLPLRRVGREEISPLAVPRG